MNTPGKLHWEDYFSVSMWIRFNFVWYSRARESFKLHRECTWERNAPGHDPAILDFCSIQVWMKWTWTNTEQAVTVKEAGADLNVKSGMQDTVDFAWNHGFVNLSPEMSARCKNLFIAVKTCATTTLSFWDTSLTHNREKRVTRAGSRFGSCECTQMRLIMKKSQAKQKVAKSASCHGNQPQLSWGSLKSWKKFLDESYNCLRVLLLIFSCCQKTTAP